MTILSTYILSIIISLVLNIRLQLIVFKDLYDNGYKYNNKMLNEYDRKVQSEYIGIKYRTVSLLVPLLNMILSVADIVEYENNKFNLYYQLHKNYCLTELSEYEKDVYDQNPSGLNAMINPIKCAINARKYDAVTINEGNKKGTIYFKADEDLNNIIITDKDRDLVNINDFWLKKKILYTYEKCAIIDYLLSQKDDITDEDIKEYEKKLSEEQKRKLALDYRHSLLKK